MTLLWVTCLIKSKPFSCIFKLVMHFYSFNEQDVKWCHWYLGIIHFLDLFSLSYKISFSIIFFLTFSKVLMINLCKIHIIISKQLWWLNIFKCKGVALNLHIYIISILLFFAICFLCNQSETEAACTCLWSLHTFHSKKK